MPYKDRGRWRGIVIVDGRRISKSFKTKPEATEWEKEAKSTKRAVPVVMSIYKKMFSHKGKSADELKAKYFHMLENPGFSIIDLVEIMLKDFDLPYTYLDLRKIFQNTVAKVRTNRVVPASIRMRTFERDSFSCQLCGRKPPEVELVVDHILPVSKGGLTEERNLRTLCRDCNSGLSNSPFFKARKTAKCRTAPTKAKNA